MNKVYIAASYPRRSEAQGLMALLEMSGVKVTSWWLREETKEGYDQKSDSHFGVAAARDIADVIEADTIICLTDGKVQLSRGGRHAEFGIALAMGKQCIIVGPREQVMHYHKDVVVCPSMADLLSDDQIFSEEATEFSGDVLSPICVLRTKFYDSTGKEIEERIHWVGGAFSLWRIRSEIKRIIKGVTFDTAACKCMTDAGTSFIIKESECGE